MFCGNVCIDDVRFVMTLESKDSILSGCEKRKDDLAKEVKERLINCVDLVQVEAHYHDNCRSNF